MLSQPSGWALAFNLDGLAIHLFYRISCNGPMDAEAVSKRNDAV